VWTNRLSVWCTYGRCRAHRGTPATAWTPSLDHARRDAEALLAGGVDGLIVENMWDLPYYVGADVQLGAVTAQAVAARAIADMADVPVGVT